MSPANGDVTRSLHWGLIGVGDIVRKRVGTALSSVQNSHLLAVAAARPESAETFARQYRIPRWHPDWRALVNDPDVQAVYVATPVARHYEQVMAAARAGKNILCEKPLGLNARQSRTMVRACQRAGVVLGTSYYRRYYPLVQRIKALLDQGEMGLPIVAQLAAFSYFDPPSDHPRYWLLQKRMAGGGPLKDFGCHRIELLLYLFGDRVKEVSLCGNARWKRDVEDTVVLGMQFRRRLFATLAVSHAAAEPTDTLDIYCSRGSLHIPCLNGSRLLILSGGKTIEEQHEPFANKHAPLIADFVRTVLAGGKFPVNGHVGLKVDRIIDSVYYG
jgi:predicted dehydrogenase